MPGYFRGDAQLLNQIAEGFMFYHALLEQSEFEPALTSTQYLGIIQAFNSAPGQE